MTTQTNAPALSCLYLDQTRVVPGVGHVDGKLTSVNFTNWQIRRFENGKLAGVMAGHDFAERDRILTKLFAAGVPCEPLVVDGRKPTPFTGGVGK